MRFWTFAALLPAVMAFPHMEPRWGNHTHRPHPHPHPTPTPSPLPPPPPPRECTPPQYKCTYSAGQGHGWAVCDVNYQWVNGGSCGPKEKCVFNSLNGSPYCVPDATPTPIKDCNPGEFQCAHTDPKGFFINHCDANGHWKEIVTCKSNEICTYGGVRGYPICTPKGNPNACTAPQYQCHYDNAAGKWGWQVCTTEGNWVDGGLCAAGQTCSFNALNGSPYCV
jgi:hypothetical protein